MSAQPPPPPPADSGPPPEMAVAELLHGYVATQLIYVAARLALADTLRDGPLGDDDLARAVGADPAALRRVMRGLVALGLFAADAEGRYTATRLGACLRSDAWVPLRDMILYSGDLAYRAYGELLHAVRTGETAFEHRFGLGLFDYLAADTDTGGHFDAFMTVLAGVIAAAVLDTYDFAAARTVVDVGGGRGTFLAMLLDAHQHLTGVLFDAPPVVAGAERHLADAGVRDRCALVAGDFFAAVPAGGDVYVLSRIIHDWDDARAVCILENCRRAMSPAGRLILVETLLPERVAPEGALPAVVREDLAMLAMTGGRERTETEYRALLAAAGFAPPRVLQTAAPLPGLGGWAIIEATAGPA